MARTWDTSIGKPVAARRRIGARRGKRGQIQEVARIARIVERPHPVGSTEELATAIIVVFKVVVELKGLARLHSDNSVQAPTVLKLLKAAAHGWKFINEIPGQAVSNVKV